jgi:hypothetical protein
MASEPIRKPKSWFKVDGPTPIRLAPKGGSTQSFLTDISAETILN